MLRFFFRVDLFNVLILLLLIIEGNGFQNKWDLKHEVQCDAYNKIFCLPTYHKKIDTYSNFLYEKKSKIFCLPTYPPSKIRVGKGQTNNIII
jgi:hypothetical protein